MSFADTPARKMADRLNDVLQHSVIAIGNTTPGKPTRILTGNGKGEAGRRYQFPDPETAQVAMRFARWLVIAEKGETEPEPFVPSAENDWEPTTKPHCEECGAIFDGPDAGLGAWIDSHKCAGRAS